VHGAEQVSRELDILVPLAVPLFPTIAGALLQRSAGPREGRLFSLGTADQRDSRKPIGPSRTPATER